MRLMKFLLLVCLFYVFLSVSKLCLNLANHLGNEKLLNRLILCKRFLRSRQLVRRKARCRYLFKKYNFWKKNWLLHKLWFRVNHTSIIKRRKHNICEQHFSIRNHNFVVNSFCSGFAKNHKSVGFLQPSKRQITFVRCSSSNSLSQAMKTTIVNVHNQQRREVNPPSANMRLFTWDNELAWLAARYTRNCTYSEHNAFDTLKQARPAADIERHSKLDAEVGFNWYAWGNVGDLPSDYIRQAMDGWIAQRGYYDPETRRCKSFCRSYLQIVWAQTYKIGCATSCCASFRIINTVWRSTTALVCAYAPRGNILEFKSSLAEEQSYSSPRKTRFPYAYGAACQLCEANFDDIDFVQLEDAILFRNQTSTKKRQSSESSPADYCVNGLCANSARDMNLPFVEGPYTTTTFSWGVILTPFQTTLTTNGNGSGTTGAGEDVTDSGNSISSSSTFFIMLFSFYITWQQLV